MAIAPLLEDASGNLTVPNPALPYACAGVAVAGLVYLYLHFYQNIQCQQGNEIFPPIVTGPIIIAIGLTLSQSAVNSCSTNWWIALVAIVVVIVCNIFGKE